MEAIYVILISWCHLDSLPIKSVFCIFFNQINRTSNNRSSTNRDCTVYIYANTLSKILSLKLTSAEDTF